MHELLQFARYQKCDINSFDSSTLDPSSLTSDYRMGWGPCRQSGCAGFVKQYGNDICERCGHHYDEHD